MTRDHWSFQKWSYACTEPAEVDVRPGDTRWVGGTIHLFFFFGSVNWEGWWGKDIQLNTNSDNMMRRMFMNPIFRGALESGPKTRSMLEMQHKTKKKIPCLCFAHFFSSRYVIYLFFFCIANAVVSVSILFLSSIDYLKVVVVNKLLGS